jgi:hypothetical protein
VNLLYLVVAEEIHHLHLAKADMAQVVVVVPVVVATKAVFQVKQD